MSDIKTIGRPTPSRKHDADTAIDMLINYMKLRPEYAENLFKPEHGIISAPCVRDSENITSDLPLLGADINTL